jgi:ribose 5-phosphate isomerase A
MNNDTERFKKQAAWRAIELVRPGMVVGLGAGTTATFALRRLAQLLQAGQLWDVAGIPCSLEVEHQAHELGVPLTTLEERTTLDMTIDGADEVDPHLDLVKGGGGSLLREKIAAQASRREIIVVDASKLVPLLGTHRPLPVEVLPFGWRSQVAFLEALGAEVVLRRDAGKEPYQTDQGNLILDAHFGPIAQPALLAARLEARAGIVAHGLFLGLATEVIIAGTGGIRHLRR